MLERVADLTWRRPRLVLAAVAVVALVAAGFGHGVEHHLKAAGFTDSSSESERATALLRDALGYDATPGIVVLVRAKDGGRVDVRDPRVRREAGHLAAELRRVPDVGRVEGPLRARDGRSLVISGHLSVQDIENDGGAAATIAKQRLRSSLLDVSFAGFAPGFDEVNDQTRADLTNAELIAFPALTVLLLLVFRGVVAALVPLLIGVLSILGTFLFLRIMAAVVDTSIFALNIGTALSLGLAVDYALLLVSRYREEAARHGHGEAAHRAMVLHAGRGVAFSGFTVAAGMASLLVMPQRFLYSVGAAGAAVGVISVLAALLVVPSIVRLLGPRIDALSLRGGPSVSDESGRWYRLARGVMRRPARVALLSAGGLVAVAAVMAGAVFTGPSAKAVPPGRPSYEPGEYVFAHYPRSVSEAITVTVDGRAGDADLAALRARLARVPQIAAVSPFRRADDRVAFAELAARGPALDGPTQDAVRSIRDLPAPPGARILVSGNTARFVDQKASLVANAPKVVAVILLGTLTLLFLLTGSVLLPLKTLLMNTLTLAATLGVLVLAFQHGWLTWALDYPGPDAIEVTSLVFLFAVTFALATDYAVLVLARIKEGYEGGMSNEEAVAHGIGRTGRIITAAAVMIAVVFLAFAVSPVFFMKQIAVGMAAGVVIDTTIVRALLVPALMRLLGDWNWWAPRPLRRLQQRVGLSEV